MLRKKLTDKNITELAQEAADYLYRGYAIIFPTDTLYALGVDATNESAINLFFSIKKRPDTKPVPVFVEDIEMAHSIAYIDRHQEEILKKLWPGAFTMILYKKRAISKKLTAGTDKIGLRIPDDKFAYNLIKKFGKPITASSANISGKPANLDIDKVIKQFKETSAVPEFIVDAGELKPSEPSTVIDITKSQPKILRIDPTSLPKLQEIFNKLNF